MLNEIRDRLNTVPFTPFKIVLNSGNGYQIQHPVYAHVGPGDVLYVFVQRPDGHTSGIRLAPEHVTEVVSEREHA